MDDIINKKLFNLLDKNENVIKYFIYRNNLALENSKLISYTCEVMYVRGWYGYGFNIWIFHFS